MRIEIALQAPGGAPERRTFTLSAPVSAGGSRADGVFLPGVAPGALRLVPVAAGAVVEAAAAGIRVQGHAVAPGARRLLRPGERAEVQGTELALEGAPTDGGTRVAAAALLRDAAAGETPVAGPRLVVLSGPAAGARHPLGAEQTLGRGRAAGIRVPDPQASRVHALVRLGEAGATIEDLGSKNGLRVNGVRVDRRAFPLAPGDEIVLGETALALEDPCPSPAPAPAGAVGTAPASAPRRARRLPPRLTAAALLALSAAALVLAAS